MNQDIEPQQRKLDGEAEYNVALDTLFGRPGQKLRIFERQLGASYIGLHRQELLRTFLLASRSHRILIVLHETANLQRDCPRLMQLLRQFGHAISINQTEPHARAACDPFTIVDQRDYVHRFHYDGARGLLGLDDPQGALTLVQRFEEIWEASAPAASATTLGL